MKNVDALKLYEYQLNTVEYFFTNDCFTVTLDNFTPEEQALFKQYFLPDWDKVEDYKKYYQGLIKDDPSVPEKAMRLLRNFLRDNNLGTGEELFPQTAKSTKQKLDKLWQEMIDAPEDQRLQAFKHYALAIIEEDQKGNISNWEQDGEGYNYQTAGYKIVGALLTLAGKGWNYWQLPQDKAFIVDEIFEIAGDLELPPIPERGNRDEHWLKLVQLVNDI